MADTDWNLHSKQLITPTDNDRMLVEPSDETAKAVEVGGFRNWLMSTALFNTLTTTAKNIIGAIEEVKGIADLNTTQLNDITQNINTLQTNKIDKSKIVNNLSATETGFVLDATQGKYLNDSLNRVLTLKNIDWIDQITSTGIYSVTVSELNKHQFPSDNSIGDTYVVYAVQRGNNASLLCMQLGFSRLAYNNLTISTKTLGTWKVL